MFALSFILLTSVVHILALPSKYELNTKTVGSLSGTGLGWDFLNEGNFSSFELTLLNARFELIKLHKMSNIRLKRLLTMIIKRQRMDCISYQIVW